MGGWVTATSESIHSLGGLKPTHFDMPVCPSPQKHAPPSTPDIKTPPPTPDISLHALLMFTTAYSNASSNKSASFIRCVRTYLSCACICPMQR